MTDGIVLQKDGPPQSLVRHWLARGTLNKDVENLLPELCDFVLVDIEPFLEKSSGTQSRLKLVSAIPLQFLLF